MAGISSGPLLKKSLCAQFFSENNFLSKAKFSQFNFWEVGSFTITTSSGSYTFGIVDLFSGETLESLQIYSNIRSFLLKRKTTRLI
jgi:hypothetical protein